MPHLGLSHTNVDALSEALLVTPVIYSQDDIKSDSVMSTATEPASQAAVLPARGCDARKWIKPLAAS